MTTEQTTYTATQITAIRKRYAAMTAEERENERYTLTEEREAIGMSKADASERLFWLDGAR